MPKLFVYYGSTFSLLAFEIVNQSILSLFFFFFFGLFVLLL